MSPFLVSKSSSSHFNTGTIGFQAIRENVKIVYIKLTEHFLSHHGLVYKDTQQEIDSSYNLIMGPTVKPNFAAMAKTAGVEKQLIQSSLSNFF